MLQCKWNTYWLNTIQCSLKISHWQHLIPVKASKTEVRKIPHILSCIGFMYHCLWLWQLNFSLWNFHLLVPMSSDLLWTIMLKNSCWPLPLGSAAWHKWQSRNTFSGCFSHFLDCRARCLAGFLQCATVILGPLLLPLQETSTCVWYGFIIISSLHFL